MHSYFMKLLDKIRSTNISRESTFNDMRNVYAETRIIQFKKFKELSDSEKNRLIGIHSDENKKSMDLTLEITKHEGTTLKGLKKISELEEEILESDKFVVNKTEIIYDSHKIKLYDAENPNYYNYIIKMDEIRIKYIQYLTSSLKDISELNKMLEKDMSAINKLGDEGLTAEMDSNTNTNILSRKRTRDEEEDIASSSSSKRVRLEYPNTNLESSEQVSSSDNVMLNKDLVKDYADVSCEPFDFIDPDM